MRICTGLVAVLFAWGAAVQAGATEEAVFEVVESDGAFEIREYESQIVAEVYIDDFDDSSGQGFRTLFKYISGENRSQAKIPMTAPVSQEAASEKIAMTAPVGQEQEGDRWLFSFMMPADYTMDTVPEPLNEDIRLREIPARRVAAVRYSGRWSGARYEEHKAALEAWLEAKGLTPAGEPVWARYNAPFMPWFLRRNEVLIPLQP